MLRIVKIGLATSVAAFGFYSGIFDLIHWHDTVGSVTMVTSMTSWEGGATSWQAVNSPALSGLGALWIIGSDLTAGVLCTMSIGRMWARRHGSVTEFAVAKKLAVAGCGVLAIMLFGGFIVVAEGWFNLRHSVAMRGAVLEVAYRYLWSILLIALFIASAEGD